MLPTLHPCLDPEFATQVLADTERWLERAVIGLNLCPFAKSVHVKKQVRYALTVTTDRDQLLAEIERELTHLANTPASARQ